jgi:polyhydroxybutyrate depolymerase
MARPARHRARGTLVTCSRTAAAVILVVWTSLDAREGPPVASSSPTTREHTITVGGRARTYLVHDFARPGTSAPVVIVLHGGGGNAENVAEMTGFDRVAARERFIAVYPNGTGSNRRELGPLRHILLTWNAGHCCASALQNRVDDVGFISGLIDALVASGRADRTRIYVTGMSNGAMLSHRLGRELSTKIAAIAPVVGAVFGNEPPPRAPVPAFIVVGADDLTVPAGGGPLRVRAPIGNRSASDRDVAPAIDQATYWARHNGCGEPARSENTASARTEWTSCSSGATVVFHSVKGNGHAWPGGRAGRRGGAQPTRAFDATEEMWRFFGRQRRER